MTDLRIGIDFDNTIARYEGIFYEAAVEQGLIPVNLPTNRESVRDHLNSTGRADDFTRLQGYVYGPGIERAEIWPGVDDFVARAARRGHLVYVISHKSVHPIVGPEYDLREYASEFLRNNNLVGPDRIPMESVYFEDSQQEKADRVGALRLDVFVDDLPEFLSRADFPSGTVPLLFDPYGLAGAHVAADVRAFRDWDAISRWLLDASTVE